MVKTDTTVCRIDENLLRGQEGVEVGEVEVEFKLNLNSRRVLKDNRKTAFPLDTVRT